MKSFEAIYCLKKKILFIYFREGEGRETEREKDVDVREKHQSVASPMLPDWD